MRPCRYILLQPQTDKYGAYPTHQRGLGRGLVRVNGHQLSPPLNTGNPHGGLKHATFPLADVRLGTCAMLWRHENFAGSGDGSYHLVECATSRRFLTNGAVFPLRSNRLAQPSGSNLKSCPPFSPDERERSLTYLYNQPSGRRATRYP